MWFKIRGVFNVALKRWAFGVKVKDFKSNWHIKVLSSKVPRAGLMSM